MRGGRMKAYKIAEKGFNVNSLQALEIGAVVTIPVVDEQGKETEITF